MEIKKLKEFKDLRGDLTPIEFKDLPFIPQRIFIVKNCSAGTRRGEHAHYKTKQFLVCLKGEIKVVIHDGKIQNKKIIKEGETVLINILHWDYQEFMTGKDILLVICSNQFDSQDYILDFDNFLKITGEMK